MPSSRGSSQPRDQTGITMSSALAVGFFTTSATWEARYCISITFFSVSSEGGSLFPMGTAVAPHQRCKGRVSPGSLEMALPISPTLPSPSPGDSGGQRGASSLGPCDTQVVPAPVGGADVSGALGDQGHVPVPSEGTWAGGKEGVGEQLGCI